MKKGTQSHFRTLFEKVRLLTMALSQERFHGTGIFLYLQQQSAAMVNKLYGSAGNGNGDNKDDYKQNIVSQAPFVAKAVFQSLTALAKNYVLRLLFMKSGVNSGKGITGDEMRAWTICRSGDDVIENQHAIAIEILISLHLLQTDDIALHDRDSAQGRNNVGYILNPFFQQALQQALLGPEEPWGSYNRYDKLARVKELTTKNMQTAHVPTKDELEFLSAAKWDALLRYVVGVGAGEKGYSNVGSSSSKFYTSTSMLIKPGGTIDRFVRSTGLMSESGSAGGSGFKDSTNYSKKSKYDTLKITALGYAYMLRSYNDQVWIFVSELLRSANNGSGYGQEQLLSLLFMLSYCEFGKGYPLSQLTTVQQQLVSEFSQLGLVYVVGPDSAASGKAMSVLDQGTLHDVAQVSGRVNDTNSSADSSTVASALLWQFYPSRMAIHMLFDSFEPRTQSLASATRVGQELSPGYMGTNIHATNNVTENSSTTNIHEGVSAVPFQRAAPSPSNLSNGLEIIVETNMQVIAYLQSPLHLALLGLFVELTVQLPNVAMGCITRDRAKAAFRMGVRVSQIVDFLCVHAHPLTRSNQPIIPTNVVDQLVLWENERLRVHDCPAILMKVGSEALRFYFSNGCITPFLFTTN